MRFTWFLIFLLFHGLESSILSRCLLLSSFSPTSSPFGVSSENTLHCFNSPLSPRPYSSREWSEKTRKQLAVATSSHQPTMLKTALVALANGAEDIEFAASVDIMRRAGIKVIVASVGDSLMVKTAQGVHIQGERLLNEVSESEHFDVIVIPGGMKGAENCRDSAQLTKLLKAQRAAGRWIAAICASPAVVLNHHSLLDDVKAVAYPSFQGQLKHKGEGRVCVDKQTITSIGPGSAVEFGMAIVKELEGEAKRNELMKGMCVA